MPPAARAQLRREACGVLALLVLALLSCRSEAPPSYIRISGAAPVLSDVPASQALLVVFWATWCVPCQEETPHLLALAEAPPTGLKVAVFSHDQDMAAIESFLRGPPSLALHLRLDEGEAAARAFGVDKLPSSFLVVNGRLVARFTGPRTWNSAGMRRLLEKLMSEPAGTPSTPAN